MIANNTQDTYETVTIQLCTYANTIKLGTAGYGWVRLGTTGNRWVRLGTDGNG